MYGVDLLHDFTIFIIGLLVICAAYFVPNSTASYELLLRDPEEFDYQARNWWISYLVMAIGAVIAVYGGSA